MVSSALPSRILGTLNCAHCDILQFPLYVTVVWFYDRKVLGSSESWRWLTRKQYRAIVRLLTGTDVKGIVFLDGA